MTTSIDASEGAIYGQLDDTEDPGEQLAQTSQGITLALRSTAC